jgi:hypothetical protein
MRHSLLAYAPLRLRQRCPAMLVEIVKLLVDDVGDVGHQGLAVRLTALRETSGSWSEVIAGPPRLHRTQCFGIG